MKPAIRSTLLLCLAALFAACAESSAPVAVAPTVAVATPRAANASLAPSSTIVLSPSPVPATVAPSPSATNVPPSATPDLVADNIVLARGGVSERLYAVMVDNHPQAYPQVGLNKAVLVFEALAEFGITRYMAVLAPGISPEATAIGPVRSARAYFVQWAMGLGAVYVHAGGSPDGLLLAERAEEVVNADALHRDAGAYFRRDPGRSAPHNLFTSSDSLAQLVSDRDVAAFDPAPLGFLLKADAPTSQLPAEQQLSYFFIYREETAGWIYDSASNGYFRLRRGRAHIDGLSGKQLWFKNVLVLEVPESLRSNDGKGRIDQQVIGEGRARLFADGSEREVLWRKESAAASLRFYTAAGAEVELNAGPVWLAALPSLDNLTVSGGG